MLHALTYSIIEHIKAELPELTEVAWMYDGISLSDKSKPYAIVEQMREFSSNIASGRRDFEETFNFQIGMYTNSGSERTRLSEKLKRTLKSEHIPYFDTSGPAPVGAGFFVCDITFITPMNVEDSSDNTNKHRVYFDVEVSVYRNNGDEISFTQ
jgi:hypothetical protein